MTGFLTIISKNYLPYARVLMQSAARLHPDAKRLVVLTDSPAGYFDPTSEPFDIIPSTSAGIPNAPWFHFRYTVLELNTAVKPWVLAYAFTHYGVDKLFYLDPDIELYQPLTPMLEALDRDDILLTPHLTAPLPNDGKEPSELDILRSGTYNLGFLALRRSANTDQLLTWWQTKLEYDCKYDFARGLFVDQRWMDLVPGLFPNVAIWRDPAYNIAYWNLPERRDIPPVFFHFSGFDATAPEKFSKYQNRFRLSDTGPVQSLALNYGAQLKANGIEQTRLWPYTYRYLADGTPIPDLCRNWTDASIEDPFSSAGADAFLNYWNAPTHEHTCITRFALALYKTRPDLATLYPKPATDDQEAFLVWLLHHGKHEHSIPEALLTPLRAAWTNLHPTHPDGSAIVAPAPPPRHWPTLPEITDLLYATRPDLQQLFPPQDLTGYTRWLLTAGQSEYSLTSEELTDIEQQQHAALAQLPATQRLRQQVLRRATRSAAQQPEAAARRNLLLNPPPPPVPQVTLEPPNPLLAGCLPEPAPNSRRVRISYLYEHYPAAPALPADCEEVWVPSSFLQDALGPRLPLPVLKVPLPLTAVTRQAHPQFTYLASIVDPVRENLAGILRAFESARLAGARLLLHLPPDLPSAPSGPNLETVTGDLEPHLATADCFITLARSEAFGLPLGRAMISGIPAICTAYAGHLELAGPNRAYLIDYVLRQAPDAAHVWAEANLSDAVEAMGAVHRDPTRAAAIAQAGQAYAEAHFSPAAIRNRLEQRLRQLS